MSSFFIGVDGGGTGTRAVLLDVEGRELGRASGAAAVANAREPDRAARAVRDVCSAAARVVGRSLPADVVWAGLSGAGREAARYAVELELGRLSVGASVRVDTDVRAAFHDAFSDGPGVLLVAGTGSIAWGRAEDGREGRVGGWGHHIGDEGSGYAIGREALRRVTRHADGRAPATDLEERVLDHLRLHRADDLVGWINEAERSEVASLAPLVVDTARSGDGIAQEIVQRAVEELEGHVLTLLENLGPWSTAPPVALSGGLIEPGRPLRESVETALERHLIRPLQRPLDPALGAARLALSLHT
ncbi:MAG: BadF/BadG/BcrA/BcrD ATPase family protein [Gemmatimonadota bacterium]